jgi:hypothetical protein
MRTVLGFAVDQLVGTWGIVGSAPTLLASAFNLFMLFGWGYPIAHYYAILSEKPYFPVQITLGLILGLLLGGCVQRRSMLWVWVLPFVILCLAVAALPTISPFLPLMLQAGINQSRLSHYFGWGCQPKNRCIDQLLITMPFYASTATSVGALVARKLRKRRRLQTQKQLGAVLAAGIIFLVATMVDLVLSSRQGWHWLFLLAAATPTAMGVYLVILALKKRREAVA